MELGAPMGVYGPDMELGGSSMYGYDWNWGGGPQVVWAYDM